MSRVLEVVVALGVLCASGRAGWIVDGERLPWPEEAKGKRLGITGNGLPKTGIPGYIAGDKLLTGSSDRLRVYDLRAAEPVDETLGRNRRGCTGRGNDTV